MAQSSICRLHPPSVKVFSRVSVSRQGRTALHSDPHKGGAPAAAGEVTEEPFPLGMAGEEGQL